MRYDQPPYPCPGCGRPRTPEVASRGINDENTSSGGTGRAFFWCQFGCSPQISILITSWDEIKLQVHQKTGVPMEELEKLDTLAGLYPRESQDNIGRDIEECWQEQTRNRGGKGGSSSKGRKKNAKGGVTFPGGNDDNRTGDEGDLGTTKPKSALKSSVHSARLEGGRRRKLQALAAKQEVSESEILGRGVDALHAIEEARAMPQGPKPGDWILYDESGMITARVHTMEEALAGKRQGLHVLWAGQGDPPQPPPATEAEREARVQAIRATLDRLDPPAPFSDPAG